MTEEIKLDASAWHRLRLEEHLQKNCPYPTGRFCGRGVVICGGGGKYFPCVWVCINMLRKVGCTLPVEVWFLGKGEMTAEMEKLLHPLNVSCVDAREVESIYPVRILNGWELKPFALLHCRFEEVLLLDADNVAVQNPEKLFWSAEYLACGAIFWPDFGRLERNRMIWSLCDIPYRDEPEFESGQMVLDKRRCWRALELTMHLNEHSDFYYRHIHGDKETFHIAWRKLEQPYAMPQRGVEALRWTMCQHDFLGNRLFQHRNLDKWRLYPPNGPERGFWGESDCLHFLRKLEGIWDERSVGVRRWDENQATDIEREIVDQITVEEFQYYRVGYDFRTMTFLRNGRVGQGTEEQERFWDCYSDGDGVILEISSNDSTTCRLRRHAGGGWSGEWLIGERMRIELTSQPLQLGAEPVPRRRVWEISGANHLTTERGDGEQAGGDSICPIFANAFPRVIHFVARDEMSVMRCEDQAKRWLYRNAGWDYHIWQTKNLPPPLAEACRRLDPFRREAFVRFTVLFEHGGLSIDGEFEFRRSFEPLLQMVRTEVFAGYGAPSPLLKTPLDIRVVGGLPGSQFVKQLIDAILEPTYKISLTGEAAQELAVSQRLMGATSSIPNLASVTIFPRHIFFPRPDETSVAFLKPISP